jgi:predicted Zn-dependent peptidase
MHNRLLWKKQCLHNGIRVLLYPKTSSLTAQVAVAVTYGANDDPEEQSGAAHFLEHMIPGGSRTRIFHSREFEHLGGFSDYFTNPEYTLSIVDVQPNKLSEASQILSALLFDECFEEEQFCVEQKIIQHELAEIEDDPREKTNEMLRQCLFKKNPIRRSVGGSKENVRNMSLKQLTEIHRQRYLPENMILILSGNFSQKTCDNILGNFCSIKSRMAIRRELLSPETALPKKRLSKEKTGLSQTYLSLGVRTTCSNNPDTAALDLLNVVLGVGASSRLFIELREKRALTYSIYSSQTDGLDFGYFNIDCALKQKYTEEAERLILKEITKIRDEDVLEAELTKGKDMILGDIFRSMDDSETCPEILAVMEMRFNSEKAIVEYVERVKRVTAEDIRNVANKYLQESQMATVVLSPKT